MAQKPLESNDTIKNHLCIAEQTFQQTLDTYNKTKLSLSLVQNETSVSTHLLTEKQCDLAEKHQQCYAERELLLKTRDSFAIESVKWLNPSILDNYVKIITEQTELKSKQKQQMSLECVVFNEMITWQSDVDKEIAELNEQLQEIDMKISSYDCDGDEKQNSGCTEIEPNSDDELLIKRLQEATTSVLETVDKTERQLKIVADQIFKKRTRQNAILTYVPSIVSTERMQPEIDRYNNVNDAEVPNTTIPQAVADDTEMDTNYGNDEEQRNSVVINVNSDSGTNWTDDVDWSAHRTEYNDEAIEGLDYLYTTEGIDKEIDIALNYSSGNKLHQYQQFDDDDDEFDIADLNV